MRRSLRGAVGLGAVGLLVLVALPSGAAPSAERSLLGIRIWRTWRDVLTKHGQPSRIEVGAVTSPTVGGGGASSEAPGMPGMPSMGGGMLPGLPGAGMGGSMGPIGMPGRGRGMAMGGSMTSGMPSSGGMGGMPIGAGPMSGGMGGGMMPGMPSTGGMMGGSIPMPPGAMGGRMMGMGGIPMPPGGMGSMSGPTGMGMPSMGGGMGMGGNQGAVTEPETTWVYEKGANTDYFLFNKDGRVIQIQAFGYKGSATTSRGLKLGDPVSKVYRLYGWPDSSTRQGDNLTLDYSTKAHAAFQLTNLRDGKGTRVVGMTVALTEKNP